MSLPFTHAQIAAIAQAHPTPFYLYDAAGIRGAARALDAAFAWAPRFRNYFATLA